MNERLLLSRWFKESGFPSFAKEGWTRPKENTAKHPLIGADGVVVSSYRLFIPNGFDNRWLETTTPSALNKERGRFLYGAATPPSRRRGLHVPQRTPADRMNFAQYLLRPEHGRHLGNRGTVMTRFGRAIVDSR